jgi:hypothetical protein
MGSSFDKIEQKWSNNNGKRKVLDRWLWVVEPSLPVTLAFK